MKKHSFYRNIIFGVLISSTVLLSGCNSRDIDRLVMNEDQRNEDAHSNPFFWDDTTPVEGYSNLYTFSPIGFNGKPYNNILNFGDKLLIAGEGYESDTSVGDEIVSEIENAADEAIHHFYYGDDAQENDSADAGPNSQDSDQEALDEPEDYSLDADYGADEDYDADAALEGLNIQYYFAVYDPWLNETVQTLSPEQVVCDYYEVVGDYLFLTDSKSNTLSIYDGNLNLVKKQDLSGFLSQNLNCFYGAQGQSVIYGKSFDNELIRIDLTKDSFSPEPVEIPFLNLQVLGVTPDQSCLVVSGVENYSLRNKLVYLKYDTLEIVRTYNCTDYFSGFFNNQGAFFQCDFDTNAWQYTDHTRTKYFLCDERKNAIGLGDKYIGFQTVYPNEKEQYTLYDYSCYDLNGNAVSSFQFDTSKPNGQSDYFSISQAYLPSLECVFILCYDANCHPSIMVWDLKNKGTASKALPSYDTKDALYLDAAGTSDDASRSSINALDNPEGYDWGNLFSAKEKAKLMEKTYGIEILIGPEVPEQIDYYHVEPCMEPDEVNNTLDSLDNILKLYPADFFQQLSYSNMDNLCVYLSGSITSSNDDAVVDPSGFVSSRGNHNIMVLDTYYAWDWNYTVNHEMSHLIDRRLDFYSICNPKALYSESTWATYNNDGFDYLYSYVDYSGNGLYENYSDYFIDDYGITYPTEDRAEVFGIAMSRYIDSEGYDNPIVTNKYVKAKLDYYSKCIRDGFDSRSWDQALPWESFL